MGARRPRGVDPGAPPAESESAAALRAQLGEEGTYHALRIMGRNLAYQFRLAASAPAIEAVGDEICNEAVQRALERAEAFDPARGVKAWIWGFQSNIVKERVRRLRRDRMHLAPVREEGPDDDDGYSRLERVHDLASQQDIGLMELLDLVGPAERAVLTHRFVDGMTGRDLARALGCAEGAARVRLSRAVNRLADAYRRATES